MCSVVFRVKLILTRDQNTFSPPIIAGHIDQYTFNLLNKLCLLFPTAECYDSKRGRGINASGHLDIAVPWTLKPHHKKMLDVLAKKWLKRSAHYHFGGQKYTLEEAKKDIRTMEMSIRVKHARGYPQIIYLSSMLGFVGNVYITSKEQYMKRLGAEEYVVKIPVCIQLEKGCFSISVEYAPLKVCITDVRKIL